jgi:hypothetical protein
MARRNGILSDYTKAALSILFLLTMGTLPARASLGQSEASVTADQQHMKSEDRVQSFQAYKVHQLTSANGTTVREYISPQGLVFEITWQGRFMPDVNQLLGTYANNLQTAPPAQTQIRRLRGLSVKTSDFVYSNFCHLLICTGAAYVPSLVPSNLPVAVMR